MKFNSLFAMLGSSILLTGSMILFTGCDNDDDPVIVEPNTIVKVATDNGFTTLVSAVKTAELEATLKGTGPFTVFAPTNAAFSAITVPSDKNVLKNILLYHTLPGSIQSTAVLETPRTYGVLTANATDSVYVRRVGSNVFINGIQVATANVPATNGVIHAIGTVLTPPAGNLVQLAVAGGFDSLAVAVTVASAAGPGSEDLLTALSNIRNATLFAPTNAAFVALLSPSGLNLPNIAAIPKATLVAVLKNHLLAQRFFANDIPAGSNTLPALQGNITLNNTATGVTVKGGGGAAANVTAVNIVAKNGCVIHRIDRVLLP